jgi:NTP pyrophosphatase (non-canonical NTP hydrolase)
MEITPEVAARIAATPYEKMVADLAKPGVDIVRQTCPQKAHLNHMAIGVSGEAGELLDAIKRHTIYDKPLDRENVVEELGDLEFYLEGLRASIGITREETLEHNKLKLLGKRYASGKYSDEQAIARADKAGA